jgi:hypothetical protein
MLLLGKLLNLHINALNVPELDPIDKLMRS